MAGLSLIYDGIVFINGWVVVDLSGGSASYDCGNKLIIFMAGLSLIYREGA